MTLEVPGDAYCYINCVFGFKMGWENSMRNQVAGQPWHKSAERHGPVYMEWGHYIAGERRPRLVYRPCTLSIGAPARVGDIMVESHWLYTCMFKIMLFVFFASLNNVRINAFCWMLRMHAVDVFANNSQQPRNMWATAVPHMFSHLL